MTDPGINFTTPEEGQQIWFVVREREFGHYLLDGELRTLPARDPENYDAEEHGRFTETLLEIQATTGLSDTEKEFLEKLSDITGVVPDEAPLNGMPPFRPEWEVGDKIPLNVLWHKFKQTYPSEADKIEEEIDIGGESGAE